MNRENAMTVDFIRLGDLVYAYSLATNEVKILI